MLLVLLFFLHSGHGWCSLQGAVELFEVDGAAAVLIQLGKDVAHILGRHLEANGIEKYLELLLLEEAIAVLVHDPKQVHDTADGGTEERNHTVDAQLKGALLAHLCQHWRVVRGVDLWIARLGPL